MLGSNTRVHFIGIGGIGMSGLAQVLLSKGYIVTGSDVKPNNLTALIESKGGKVFSGHRPQNADGAEIVVYSSSISGDNPELLHARKKGIEVVHRGQLLAELMKERLGVAVTGAHGKTTTASMISEILIRARLDPLCILGGESLNLNGNVHVGKGKFLVAEADESDGSHLYLEPQYAVITNIDREHLDYYHDIDHIIEVKAQFLGRLRPGGVFFGLIDNEFVRRLLLRYDGRFATFGLSPEANLYAVGVKMEGMKTRFECVYNKRPLGAVTLNVPGMHNVSNALAAILFALHTGVDFGTIAQALFEFRSAKRRFEVYPGTGAITLIEDYAHHPTEISATLQACRLLSPKRVITVFQPHRYTRTLELSREFGTCFGESDELILTNIYPASEEAIDGVSVENIYKEVLTSGFKNVTVMPMKRIVDYLVGNSRDGDLVAVLGAGDINEVARQFSERIRAG